jgi:DNA (cytosine-5)-methyltransferase 1
MFWHSVLTDDYGKNNLSKEYFAVNLFSGCGGLSEGLRQAGFHVIAAVEKDNRAAKCYKENHPQTFLLNKDIRKIEISTIKRLVGSRPIHLLAGCPPCQGFSSVRRLNRKRSIRDDRNSLIFEFLRFIRGLKPMTIMMENVPGVIDYYRFQEMVKTLVKLGYFIDYDIVNIEHYGVPQRRRRFVLVGSVLAPLKILHPPKIKRTVRDAIGKIESISMTDDPLHKIVTRHTSRIQKLINMIPLDGGSRTDLPKKYQLKCHKKPNVGFNDIYGRLKWDSCSSTITGGCLNPSKGRFLHPKENRVITPREAALLQTFPRNYKFPLTISKTKLALMIGNALPPEFSRIQTAHILEHIKRFND